MKPSGQLTVDSGQFSSPQSSVVIRRSSRYRAVRPTEGLHNWLSSRRLLISAFWNSDSCLLFGAHDSAVCCGNTTCNVSSDSAPSNAASGSILRPRSSAHRHPSFTQRSTLNSLRSQVSGLPSAISCLLSPVSCIQFAVHYSAVSSNSASASALRSPNSQLTSTTPAF